MFRTFATSIVLACLAIGCATFQPGQAVVRYQEGQPLRMGEAPEDGRYALFSGTDVRNPEVTYSLSRGDRLGFVERDGAVYAVAGNNESRIQTGTITRSYFWRRVGR